MTETRKLSAPDIEFIPSHHHSLKPTKRGLVLFCAGKRMGLLAWSDLTFMRENKQTWTTATYPHPPELLAELNQSFADPHATATAPSHLPHRVKVKM